MKLTRMFIQFQFVLTIVTGASLLNGANAMGFKLPAIPMPDNTHLIDQDPATGFEIWRSSKPNKASDFKKLCASGVREMMVLDGTGSIDEAMAAKYCPGFKVVFNVNQSTKTPLTAEFLAKFDQWVTSSRVAGKKIAFRCNCGCHRTGRLAAYYQMKYQGLSPSQAIDQMYKYGKYMFLFPYLKPQVRALGDFVASKPCSQGSSYCVTTETTAAVTNAAAPADAAEAL
jgi:hypothetical protein